MSDDNDILYVILALTVVWVLLSLYIHFNKPVVEKPVYELRNKKFLNGLGFRIRRKKS